MRAFEPGVHVTFSGAFFASRAQLVRAAEQAGLIVDPELTGASGLVVANDAGSGSLTVRTAIQRGIPLIDEYAFESLVGQCQRTLI